MPNKNTCNCPVPPGGRAVCEATQLAICRIIDDQPVSECIAPPLDVEDASKNTQIWQSGLGVQIFGQQVVNWLLAKIYNVNRIAFQSLTIGDKHVLDAGFTDYPVSGWRFHYAPGTIIFPALRAFKTELNNVAMEVFLRGAEWTAEVDAKAHMVGVDTIGIYGRRFSINLARIFSTGI